jgi:1,4-alpha-glucan branching enzyme
MSPRLALGARPEGDATHVRAWAPDVESVVLRLRPGSGRERRVELERGDDGYRTALLPDARPGDRYDYLLDGRGPFPDPASRVQPESKHGKYGRG